MGIKLLHRTIPAKAPTLQLKPAEWLVTFYR